MATYEITLEPAGNGVRVVPVSGDFVFVQVEGKWQILGVVQ